MSRYLIRTLFACLILLPIASANAAGSGFEENVRFPDIAVKLREKSAVIPGSDVKKLIKVKPAIFVSQMPSEITSMYCKQKLFCDFILPMRVNYFVEKRSAISLEQNLILDRLEELNESLRKDPVDAKFDIENENMALFSPEEKGYEMDLEKSASKLYATLLSPETIKQTTVEVELPSRDIEPRIKAAEINKLGISSLIGEGRSNFKGSSKSRVHNLTTAAKRFDGLIIKPDEEFSFIDTLGPVDGEHGYLPELVILNKKTQPEFGGGICQVSTTMFRAALNSGLEITERRNHAFALSYYGAAGMDATVYIPKPDLKYINNTPENILIKLKIEGTELVYQIYGTDDGRKIEVSQPAVVKRNEDGSFLTSFNQKVIDKNGSTTLDAEFKSFYRNIKELTRQEKLTEKPKDWSSKEWRAYKKANNIP